MSTNDIWILVSVPRPDRGRPSLGGLATTAGLALLSWGDRLRDRPVRTIDVGRIERPAVRQRPFC